MTTTATYQRRIASGAWVNLDSVHLDSFIGRILEREPWYAPRVKRTPMTTAQEVLDRLASGEEIDYGDDWHAMIRMTPEPVNAVESAPDLVRCSCGDTCDRNLVMSASLGTSCPDCYDRMSS